MEMDGNIGKMHIWKLTEYGIVKISGMVTSKLPMYHFLVGN